VFVQNKTLGITTFLPLVGTCPLSPVPPELPIVTRPVLLIHTDFPLSASVPVATVVPVVTVVPPLG